MAITQNPIIGRTRKSAGGMVFSTVYGQNVMRAKPASYNDNPNASQIEQRTKMALLTQFVASIKTLLSIFIRKTVTGRSLFSEMISCLSPVFQMGETVMSTPYGLRTIQNGSVLMSLGLTKTNGVSSLTVGWTCSNYPDVDVNDYDVHFVIRNNTKQDMLYDAVTANSSSESYTFNYKPAWEQTDDYSVLCIAVKENDPSVFSEVVVL